MAAGDGAGVDVEPPLPHHPRIEHRKPEAASPSDEAGVGCGVPCGRDVSEVGLLVGAGGAGWSTQFPKNWHIESYFGGPGYVGPEVGATVGATGVAVGAPVTGGSTTQRPI